MGLGNHTYHTMERARHQLGIVRASSEHVRVCLEPVKETCLTI